MIGFVLFLFHLARFNFSHLFQSPMKCLYAFTVLPDQEFWVFLFILVFCLLQFLFQCPRQWLVFSGCTLYLCYYEQRRLVLGFRHYAGPCHLEGHIQAGPWPAQAPMAATSLLSLYCTQVQKVCLREKLCPFLLSSCCSSGKASRSLSVSLFLSSLRFPLSQ